MTEYRFEDGPPDTTALSTAERIEVMRQYRRWKEQPKRVDFSAGVPDVSELPRGEQLQVLREYRAWREVQAKPASPSPQTAAGIRVGCVLRDEQAPPNNSPGTPRANTNEDAVVGAAGATSQQRQTPLAHYFERPVTARAPAVTPAWVWDAPAEPEAPSAPPAAEVWDGTGVAGLHTTQRPPNCFGWIEQTSSRPGTAREVRTEQRVFAPLPSADGAGPAGNRARSEAQREARLLRLDEAAAETHRSFDAGGFVAGTATPLNAASARDLLAPPPPAAAGDYRPPGTPRQGDAGYHGRGQGHQGGYGVTQVSRSPILPDPVQGHGEGATCLAPEDGAAAAGMRAAHDKREARGMVAVPDERQAANYNYKAKLATGAPYLGGGERYQQQLERSPMGDTPLAVVDTNRSDQVSFYEAGRARRA